MTFSIILEPENIKRNITHYIPLEITRDLTFLLVYVYEISCKNSDFTYVGETGRLLGTRIKEQRKGAVKIQNKV